MNRDQYRLYLALWSEGWMRPSRMNTADLEFEQVTLKLHGRNVEMCWWPDGRDAVGRGPVYVGPFQGRGWTSYTVKIVNALRATSLPCEQVSVLLATLGGGGSCHDRLGWKNALLHPEGWMLTECRKMVEAGLLQEHGAHSFMATPRGCREVGVGP